MSDGSDLWVAMNRAALNVTDLAALAECSRPTVYAWKDCQELPYKAQFLHDRIIAALDSGRLPMRDKPTPAERPKMARIAVYGA